MDFDFYSCRNFKLYKKETQPKKTLVQNKRKKQLRKDVSSTKQSNTVDFIFGGLHTWERFTIWLPQNFGFGILSGVLWYTLIWWYFFLWWLAISLILRTVKIAPGGWNGLQLTSGLQKSIDLAGLWPVYISR